MRGLSLELTSQSSLPRSDLVRTLTRLSILSPLSRALALSSVLHDDLARSATAKIVQILLVFAQSDLPTKEAVSSAVVVGNLLRSLGALPADQLGHLIKVFRHLSSSSPAALSSLQSAGTIPALVRVLASVVARSVRPPEAGSGLTIARSCRTRSSATSSARCTTSAGSTSPGSASPPRPAPSVRSSPSAAATRPSASSRARSSASSLTAMRPRASCSGRTADRRSTSSFCSIPTGPHRRSRPSRRGVWGHCEGAD